MNFKPVLQSQRGDTIGVMFAPKRLSTKDLSALCENLRKSLAYLYTKGVEITYKGEKVQVYARIVCVTGDNLFMNYFFGLTGENI